MDFLVPAIQCDVRRKIASAVLRMNVPETVVGDLRRWPKVPFAHLRCDLAGLLQTLGNRLFFVEAIQ